jgi:hypothetical protein
MRMTECVVVDENGGLVVDDEQIKNLRRFNIWECNFWAHVDSVMILVIEVIREREKCVLLWSDRITRKKETVHKCQKQGRSTKGMKSDLTQ